MTVVDVRATAATIFSIFAFPVGSNWPVIFGSSHSDSSLWVSDRNFSCSSCPISVTCDDSSSEKKNRFAFQSTAEQFLENQKPKLSIPY